MTHGSSVPASPRTPRADHWRQRKFRIFSRNIDLKSFCNILETYVLKQTLKVLFVAFRNVVGHAPAGGLLYFNLSWFQSQEIIKMFPGSLVHGCIQLEMYLVVASQKMNDQLLAEIIGLPLAPSLLREGPDRPLKPVPDLANFPAD